VIWLLAVGPLGLGLCARAGQLDDAAGMGDGIHYFSYYCTRWDCVAELPSRAALDRHLVDHEPVVPADDILAGCNLCPPAAPHVPDASWSTTCGCSTPTRGVTARSTVAGR
jgi:hypothetical protein